MNYEDFAFELKRLDAIKIPKSEQEATERKALEQELWRKYSWMLPPQWQATVSWVIDKHKGKALPPVQEFGAAVGMMREKGVIKTEACRSCGGTKMQYLRVRHTPTGREFDACKPCSVCMIASDWEIKKDLEVLSEGRSKSPLRMAHELTPSGAYWTLHRAANLTVNWDADVLAVLVDKAAQYEAEEEQRKAALPPMVKRMSFEPMREAAPVAVGSSAQKVIVNGEEYEVEE